jgi:molybdate transport system substrate-binding protein
MFISHDARALAFVLATAVGMTAQATDITVSAAASLTNAFKDLAPMFEAAHPGTRVQYNFAASGALMQQIAKGAPVDVFASADQETMDQAQSRKLVEAAQRRNFVSNSLVVIVPITSVHVPKDVGDLTRAGYQRIAIGLPASVPVGRYTKSVLEAAGIWGAIEPKMIGANNVRQALDYVARAEVDAGFVYVTDVEATDGRLKAIDLPENLKPQVAYGVAIVKGAKHPEQARQFVDGLLNGAGKQALARAGFLPPP